MNLVLTQYCSHNNIQMYRYDENIPMKLSTFYPPKNEA